jgi:hypothetical protein
MDILWNGIHNSMLQDQALAHYAELRVLNLNDLHWQAINIVLHLKCKSGSKNLISLAIYPFILLNLRPCTFILCGTYVNAAERADNDGLSNTNQINFEHLSNI